MDRKRTMKIVRTPNTSFQLSNDDTLYISTPKPKSIAKKKVIEYEEPEIKPVPNFEELPDMKFISMAQRLRRWFYENKFWIATLLVGIFFMCINSRYCKTQKEVMMLAQIRRELESQKTSLAQQIRSLQTTLLPKTKRVFEHLSNPWHGAHIDFANTGPRYKRWWHLQALGKEPSVILDGKLQPGECFVLDGHKGTISIYFQGLSRVDQLIIAHPITNNRKSAINEFEVVLIRSDGLEDSIGTFNYLLNRYIIQKYDIRDKNGSIGIRLVIKSNHGNFKYTCVYKIMVYGETIN
ncbi:Sperm-associated antigen 4 protein [Astathelohania contejeani]|uniref:Sperm-associated antigen 4 protein n=1 Tax=Astathelohania contejeani TaxID=164912 RepID=A0ABQ7I1S2_9MICR|nr:Sperm-associated antigen 4 protein [Thelohania contejeani]